MVFGRCRFRALTAHQATAAHCPHVCRHKLSHVVVNSVNHPQCGKIPQRHFQNVERPIATLTGHLMR
jgi:hypothetical protein